MMYKDRQQTLCMEQENNSSFRKYLLIFYYMSVSAFVAGNMAGKKIAFTRLIFHGWETDNRNK